MRSLQESEFLFCLTLVTIRKKNLYVILELKFYHVSYSDQEWSLFIHWRAGGFLLCQDEIYLISHKAL